MASKTDSEGRSIDPETLNRKQRIKAIHDARQRVHEKSADAYDAMVSDQIDRKLANTIVRRSVEQYIMEVEALAKSDDDIRKTYWEEYDLGEVDLPTRTVEFRGLESILEASEFLVDEWEEQIVDDVQGKDTNTVSVQRQLPMGVLMSAYRATNALCADAGLDIDIQQAQEFQFDYSDIVD